MSYQHKDLANGGWEKLSFLEQMANIGSEVERTLNWRAKGNADYALKAFERALELIDLILENIGNIDHFKEIRQGSEPGKFHRKSGRLLCQALHVLRRALSRNVQSKAGAKHSQRFDCIIMTFVR